MNKPVKALTSVDSWGIDEFIDKSRKLYACWDCLNVMEAVFVLCPDMPASWPCIDFIENSDVLFDALEDGPYTLDLEQVGQLMDLAKQVYARLGLSCCSFCEHEMRKLVDECIDKVSAWVKDESAKSEQVTEAQSPGTTRNGWLRTGWRLLKKKRVQLFGFVSRRAIDAGQ